MKNEQIEKVSNTVEIFGKGFEVSAATLGLLKIAGVGTLGLASVFSSGIVPIVVASTIGAVTLTKYALEQYNNNHESQNTQNMLPKPLNERIPEADTKPLDITRLSIPDKNIIAEVGNILKKYGVSPSYGQLGLAPKKLIDPKVQNDPSTQNSVT